MKKIGLLLAIAFVTLKCISQEKNFSKEVLDSLNHKRIYKIEIGNTQAIELTETKNSKYKGTLTNKVWKSNRKGIPKKQILNRIKIPDSMVKRLMNSFKKDGITKLKDCMKVGDCLLGADGTTTIFKTYENGLINQASFWQLHSDSYNEKKEIELYQQVVKARKVYSHIKDEFDSQKLYDDFIKRLPRGTYFYGMIILTKR